MSTRATYHFPDVTVYIHFDGYPDGAAEYFHAAMQDERGSWGTRFIRRNELAEITGGEHSDTEYRYTVSDAGVLTIEYRPFGGRWLHVETYDSVAGFLTAYGYTLVTVERHGRPRALTVERARALLAEQKHTLTVWEANGHGDSYNAERLRGEIHTTRRAIEAALTADR